jgi:hypothetical protein
LLGGNAHFTADTLGGTLAAGQRQDIKVTPNNITRPASVVTDAYSDVLTITTNILGDEPHKVALMQNARGAIIGVTAPDKDFGEVNAAFSFTLTPAFTVVNNGNAEATVVLTSDVSADVGVDSPTYTINGELTSVTGTTTSDFPLGGYGADTDIDSTFTPGPDFGASQVVTVITTSAPLCEALPAADTLTFIGLGTNADASWSGGAGSFVFPAEQCGSPSDTPQSIIATNAGNQEFKITSVALTLGTSSAFSAFIGAPGIVMADVPPASAGTPGTAVITVVPKFRPAGTTYPDPLTDTLTITYSYAGVPQTPDRVYPVSQTVNCP